MVRLAVVPLKVMFSFGTSARFEEVADKTNAAAGLSTSPTVVFTTPNVSSLIVKLEVPSVIDIVSTNQPTPLTLLSVKDRQRSRAFCPATDVGKFTVEVMKPAELPRQEPPLL